MPGRIAATMARMTEPGQDRNGKRVRPIGRRNGEPAPVTAKRVRQEREETLAHRTEAQLADAAARTGDRFGRFAASTSAWLGSKWAFVFAALVIVLWAVSGPLFHYSDTWQLVINTGTTIVTFLMVFLIQNTQNRDARAINLKLNELIRAIDAARDQMIAIESLSDVELNLVEEKFDKFKASAGNLPAEK
jgi:low affinity Fe/Cu permease